MVPHRTHALKLLRLLRQANHTAYLAGGCVRDQMLGITPKDLDIATSATPDETVSILPNCQLVGKAFGVVICRPVRGIAIEVATFRRDEGYSDRRRPDRVSFCDAKEDAQRRDFTINGLFSDPLKPDASGNDQIIDYVGGIEDLNNKCLRAIGDPEARFGEDYLRMLRGVRFAARLGFKLDDATANAIQQHAPDLGRIARERIGDEVKRMLEGPAPLRAASLLESLGLADICLNQAATKPFKPHVMARLVQGNESQWLAAWSADRGQPLSKKTRGHLRHGLCLSNDCCKELENIETITQSLAQWETLSTAKRKRLAAHPHFMHTCALYRADPITENCANTILKDVGQLKDDGIGLSPDPFIRGADLISSGMKPGPSFQPLIEQLYDEQLEGFLPDKDSALKRLNAEINQIRAYKK